MTHRMREECKKVQLNLGTNCQGSACTLVVNVRSGLMEDLGEPEEETVCCVMSWHQSHHFHNQQ